MSCSGIWANVAEMKLVDVEGGMTGGEEKRHARDVPSQDHNFINLTHVGIIEQ